MILINISVQVKSRPVLRPTQSPIQRVQVLFPRGKTTVASKVKSEWSYTSTAPICVDRDKFKFYSFFLAALAKLRKATISFVISVRPSAWNKSALTERIFMKFDTREFFENLSRKFKFYYNLARVAGTLHNDRFTL